MATKYVFNSFPVNDDEARNAIIKAIDQNIFVIAGAGSGKTSMLVNRMVSLIEQGKATIDKICAITFTINAAAEFLERLSKTLERRSKGIQKPEDFYAGGLGQITPIIQDRDRVALQNIDLCFAGTIDSFCNLVLSEYPLDAGIPSSSAVLSEEDSLIIYEQEYARLSHQYSAMNDESYNAFVRLFRNPKDTFSKSIKDVVSISFLDVDYQKPTQSLDDYIKDFKNRFETNVKNDLKKVLNSYSSLKPNDSVLEAFDNLKLISGAFFTSGGWSLNEILRLKELSASLEKLTYSSDPNISAFIVFKDQSKKQNGTLFKLDADCDFEKAVKEIDVLRHNFAIDFLLSCANEVKNKLKQEGKLTFEEYLYTFKELIKKDTLTPNKPLINHIRQRFEYFLLDESQDTSPFQYQIFLLLCSRNAETDVTKVDLIPGSIFIVGDPKQSIYRFRNADIDSYNLIKGLFNEPIAIKSDYDNLILELTNNFRSSGLLCNYFNSLFDSNGSLPLDGYKKITNVSSKRTTNNEGLYTFNDYVEVIKSIVDNPTYQIDDCEIECVNDELIQKVVGTHNISFKDIMILTSGKKNLSEILTTLEKNNIPCYSEDDNRLAVFAVSEVIYDIFCYIAYPDSQAYYHNLVTSPLFGLDKKESLSTANGLKLSSAHKQIIQIIDSYRAIDNPILLFERILNDMSLFDYVPIKRTDYAYYMLNKLKEAYVNNVISSLQDSVAFLNDLMITPQERVAMLQFKPNAVRIANVHKVKGLEAPVVIILKSGTRNFEQNVTRSVDFIHNKACLIKIGKNEFTYDSQNTVDYEQELKSEAQQAELENKRLHYVAATRARDYLFIQECDSYHKCWQDLIYPDLFKSFVVNEPQVLAFEQKIAKKEIAVSQIYGQKVAESFDANPTYEIVLPSKLAISHSGNNDIIIPNQIINTAAEKGTLIHALMEIYVSSDMKYSNDEVVEETLERYGFTTNNAYRELLNKVITAMTSGGFIQENGKKEDLFEELKGAKEIYCEYPFSYLDNSVNPPKLFNGTIDLLYVKDGKYHIVDYKTNYDDSNLTDTYQGQLDAYMKALKEILNIDSDARIYHIDIK